jgi:hypothetical protein
VIQFEPWYQAKDSLGRLEEMSVRGCSRLGNAGRQTTARRDLYLTQCMKGCDRCRGAVP